MNKAYKVVYNETTGTYVAVAEIESSRGKKTSSTVQINETGVMVDKLRALGVDNAKLLTIPLAVMSIFTVMPEQAEAANTIFINDGNDSSCINLYDDGQTGGFNAINGGGKSVTDIYSDGRVSDGKGGHILGTGTSSTIFGSATINPCQYNGGTGAQNRDTQTNRTLFYANNWATTPSDGQMGATSLTLGGRLDVNSGVLGLGNRGTNGDGNNSIRIGTGTTLSNSGNNNTNSIAIGVNLTAAAANSVAIGSLGSANGASSIALGQNARAQNTNSVAVGTNTIAGNQNDVVIGNNITSTSTLLTSSAEATSKEFGTIAIGNEVNVGGTRMVVIGNESGMTVGSGTDSHDSIAIGTQTRLNGQRVIAIGTGVNNIGINSIAMGSYSNVDFASQGGTAVGRETKLQNSFLGTAIGNQTHVVGSDGGTAVGDRHKVTNSGYAAAFGSRAEVTDSANAIAIGAATKVTGASNGIAIGRDSATSAENGLALGTASSTSGSASIAIGSNSKNPAANSIALGHKASIVNAQNVGAIVIGDNARSEYYGAAEQFVIAIGANSNSYAYSVALGKEASADRGAYDAEGGSIAIGYRANTTDASRASIAMGVNSQVTSQYGVAIGTQSKASGANATAMGHNALASRANSIVIGTNAVSNGVADSTVVIGDGASSVGDGSQGIIIGAKSSNNDAVNSITIGHDASTYKGDAVVNIGYGANTSAGYSVTIGPNAASFGAISAQHQVTIGSGANTSAANAIAVGHSAASAGSKAAAFGYQSNASALSAMALGSQSTASGIYSVAVGDSSKAIDRYAIAMGYQSNASGPDSIAIGVGSAASGNQSIAVGYKNQVTGNNSGAFGDPNVISGNNSYALGNNNTISGNSTHVLGNNNTAKGSSSYIIGNNSSTELSNDIAIGTEAKTGISTQPTEGFSGAQVAIGYKATTGTDGQIALGTMTNAGAVNHTIAIGTKATTTGNSSIAVGRNAASSGLNAAAVGVGATAVGSSSAAYGTNSNSEGGNSVAIGSAAHSASTNSIALGNTSEVTANNAIAIGSGAVASVANSVALGNGATTSAAVGTASTTLGNTTFNVAGTTPTGTVSVGKAGSERTVTNVAAGRVTATSTDAINGSQLYVVAAFADQGLNFTANSGGTVNRDLGQTLNIVGSLNNKALTIEPTSVAATAGQYSARNTQTVSDPTTGRIQIQFADRPTLSGVVLDGKDGQDAGIQFGKDGLSLKGVGVDGKDGITIVGANGKDGITFNKDGTITNVVQSTTPDGLATNKSVDDKVAANKALGLNFTGNTGPTLHRDLGQTLSIIGSAQTLNKSSDATKETTAGSYYARNLQTVTVVNSLTGDTTLQMLLADRPTFSGVVLDGKDGKDASIQFGKDGLSLKGVGVDGKDGITIVGANGKDGITFNKDGTITNVVQSTGPDGLVTNKQLDDTKALGLNFTGNAGGTVHRNLGETLNIIGSAQGLNKTFDTATTGSTTGAYYSRNLQTVTDPITGRVQVQFADRPTLSGVVLDGKDGKDASIQFGKDGLSLKGVGVDGKDGITIVGANGKDGITFNQDGTITNVVQNTDPDGLVTNKQLDDTKALGLNFTGNAGGTVHRNLGETLNIIGSAQSLNKTFDTATTGSTTGAYYSRNLQTVTDPNTGRVQVQFADRPTLSGVVLDGKDGKDASVQFGKDGLSITGLGVNGKDGIGIQGMTGANGKDGISFNPDGTISNVTDGKNPGDVATKDQIDKLASGGLDFLGNAGGLVHRNLGQTLSIIGSAQNLNKAFDNAAAGSTTGEYYSRNLQTVTDPNTGRVQVQFADRPTLSGVVLDGKDGKDASVQFGKDGLSITGLGVNGKDGIGIQGMTGANGKDGISFNPDGTISNVTDGKNPGDVATKDQIDKLASGGLDFLGNAGGLVHRNLGQTLSIIGSAQNLNKAFDNAAAGSTTGEYYSRNLQTVTDPNTGRVQVQFADRPTLSGVVLDGKDGKDASVQFGKDGLSITGLGVNGKDGIGIQGMTGANGKDGISFNPDGTISNVTDGKNPGDVATKDQIDKLASGGLDFLGNAGGLVHRNLGQTLSIIGSAQNLNKAFDNAAAGSTTGEYYSRNLQTVTDPNTGRVQVQFADRPTLSGVVLDGKDGKDASVQFGKDGLSITGLGVNGKDGIGIQGMTGANGKDGISFNPDGTISNVTDGKNPGDVATKDQIDKLASGGLDFLGNAGGLVHRNLGQTLSIIGSAQNLNKAFDNAAAGSTTGEYYSRNLQTVTDPNTGRVQVQFADRPTLSGVVLDGKDGKDASVQFGKDGLSITGLGVNGKDGIGIQGMTGANGKDGISFNPDGTISNVTDGKNPGDVATKDQIDKLASGGLDFLGNAGGLVHRNLGQTLSIIGSAQNLNKAFDNAAAGSTTGEYYSRNLQTVTDPNTGRVQVQFADRPTLSGVVLDGKDGKDASVQFGKDGLSITGLGVNGKDGIGIQGMTGANGKDGISFNPDGTISNVTDGKNPGDVATKDQIDKLASGGLDFLGNAGGLVHRNLGQTLSIIGSAQNLNKAFDNAAAGSTTGEYYSRNLQTVTDPNTGRVQVQFADRPTLSGVVLDGKDGKDASVQFGKDGLSITGLGVNGKDGIGIQGMTGANGKDGISFNPDGTISNVTDGKNPGDVATKDQIDKLASGGLDFLGNAGGLVHRNLGQTLSIIGSAQNLNKAFDNAAAGSTTGEYYSRNLQTVTDPNTGRVQVQFADRPTLSGVVLDGKDGKDASVQFGKDGLSITGLGVNGKDGIGIQGMTGANGKDGISFNPDGTISNVTDGKNPGDVVNKGQLDDIASAGLDFTANSGALVHRDLGQTLGVIGSETGLNLAVDTSKNATASKYNSSNIQTVTTGNGIQVQFADRPEFSGLVVNGKDGKDASIQFTDSSGNKGTSLVGKPGADGAPGLTVVGKDGKDGVSFNNDGTISNVTDGTRPNDAVNKGQLDDIADGLTNSGLSFTDDAGTVIHRKLGETLGLTTTSVNMKTVVGKDGIAINFSDRPEFSGLVVNGKDGKDASIQFTDPSGNKGASLVGKPGADGLPGLTVVGKDGKDGVSFNNDGTISNVTDGTRPNDAVNKGQLDDIASAGLDFTANSGALVHRDLGQTLGVIGSETGLSLAVDTSKNATAGKYNSSNVQTVTTSNGLQVQFADRPEFSGLVVNGKDGKDASIQFTDPSGNKGASLVGKQGADGVPGLTVVGKDGKDGVSFNNDGTISNVTDGTRPKDAVNKGQLDDIASAGLDFTANSGALVHRDLGQTLGVIGSETGLSLAVDTSKNATAGKYNSSNIQTVTTGNGIQMQFADRPEFSGLVVNGKDGKDASIQFTDPSGNKGASLVGKQGADGVPGLTVVGKDGKDGVSFNNDGTISNVTDGTRPKDAVNKGQLDGVSDALTNSGLNFTDDAGTVIHRKLGETLGLTTTSVNMETVVGKDGIAINFSDRPEFSGLVVNGKDGKDASIQFTDPSGNKGASLVGKPGADGVPGLTVVGKDGKDGVSFNNDGTISNLADGTRPKDAVNKGQLDGIASDGLNFTANSGALVHRDLGQTLGVIGSETGLNLAVDTSKNATAGKYNSSNIQTVTTGNGIQMQFADRPEFSGLVVNGKDGKDASIQFTDPSGNKGASLVGKQGADGVPGLTVVGKDGKDGVSFNNDGTISNVTDGTRPKDAVNKGQLDGVSDALTNSGLNFTDDAGTVIHRKLGETLGLTTTSVNMETVVGKDGIAINFSDRPEFSGLVVNGKDGKDASIQFTDPSGNKGASLVGKPGADGLPGLTVVGKDGKDGVSFNNDGTISNLADGTRPKDAVNKGQLDGIASDGLNFTANSGALVHRDLGQTLGVIGSETGLNLAVDTSKDATAGKYSASNIQTVTTGEGIQLQFADRPEFSGLVVNGQDGQPAQIQFTDSSGNPGTALVGKPGADGLPGLTVVGKDGKDGVSFNNDGTISNLADGTRPKDAVNLSQLTGVSDALTNAGLNFTDDAGTVIHRKLGETLGLTTTSVNMETVVGKDGIAINFSDRPEFSGLVVNGKDGKDASIQFTDPSGNKGAALVGKPGADGLPGLTVVGKDGKDGVSFNNDGTISNVTDGTRPKDAVNKGQLDGVSDALTNSGLNFTDDAGTVIHRKLGETLGLTTTSVNMETVVGKDGIAINFSDRPEFSGLVVNGKDGKDASIQFTDPSGNKGASLVGKPGADGVPGLTVVGKDGKDGVSFNNDGTISNLADGFRPNDAVNKGQLDGIASDGLNFTANSGALVHRDLGQTLGVIGSETGLNLAVDTSKDATAGKYSASNIQTVTTGEGIQLQFADRPEFSGLVVNGKDGKDASIQFTDPSGNKGASLVGKPGADGLPGLTVVGKDGKDGVSFNNDGTISNLADGFRPNDAVNKGQLDGIASDGLNFTANSGALVHRDLGQTLGVIGSETGLNLAVDTSKDATAGKYSASNIQTVTTGEGIQLQFADRPEFSGLVVNGQDGQPAQIQFTDSSGNPGTALVGKPGADGLPGLTVVGKDGKDGVSFNNDGTISNLADGTRPKDAVNLSQLDGVSDALTNAGLSFTDDAGTVIHRKLGETLGLTTTSPNMETVVGKDGIAINFSDRPEFSGLVVNGKDGKDASIQFTDPSGNKGASLVGKPGADGVPGLTVVGKDGKDGVSFNNDGTISNLADGFRPNDAVNKGQLDGIASDGLNFTANSGALVHRDLGQTLGVIGSETGLNLAVDTSKDATAGKYSASNIQTVTTGEGIQLQFADRPEFSGLVVNGKDGKDASIQFTDPSGNKGASLVGKPGADGLPGLTVVGKDGKDGVSFNNDGTISNLADGFRPNDAVNKGQLDGIASDGLNFTANSGALVHRDLGQTLGVIGSETGLNLAVDTSKDATAGKYSASNIQTVTTGEGIQLQFADRPEFSGLVVNGQDGQPAQIQFTDSSGNPGTALVGKPGADGLPGLTVVGKDGKDGVSFNNDGTISNLADGTRPKDAVNLSQLTGVSDALTNAGLSFTDDAGTVIHRKLGETLGLTTTSPNMETVVGKDGIAINFSDRPEFSGLVVNGKDGKDASIQFTDPSGNKGASLVGKPGADGVPGLTVVGKDGKDGVSFNNDGTISNVTDGTRPKDAVNKGQLDGVSDALTNSGLNFTDDAGTVIHRKLGETLGLTTTSPNMETVVGKDGIAINFSDRPEFSGLVVNGKDGKDASIQFTDPSGNKGASLVGKPGADGLPGLTVVGKDGKDGVSFNNDGTISNLADGFRPNDAVNKGQLDGIASDGLNFTANSGALVHRDLGQTLGVIGSETGLNLAVDTSKDATAGKYSASNIQTVTTGEGIQLQFADRPEFSGLVVNGQDGQPAQIQFTDSSGNPGTALVGKPGADGLPGLTVVGKDGKDGVSFNNDGTISNLADGTRPKDAVNLSQLDGVSDALTNAGLSFTDDAGTVIHRKLGETLGLTTTSSNMETVVGKDGIAINFSDRPEFSGLVVNGKDGKDASIQFTDPSGNKGASLVGKPGADGVPGLTVVGKDGKDGVSFNNDGTISNLADGTRPNDAVNKSQLDGVSANLTSDGLNFTASDGNVIHRDLGDTLSIIGALTGLGISEDKSLYATAGDYSAKNIQTVVTKNGLQIQLADRPEFSGLVLNGKDGQDASIQFADSKGHPGFSIVGTAGSGGVNPSLTFVNSFGEEGVKLVADGRITNVAEGKDGKDAVNVDQLTTVSNVANRGWDVSTNGGPVHNVAPGSQVDFSNNDGNVVIANQAGNITVGLAKNVTVDSIDLGGTVLNQGGLTIKDGPSITQGGIDMAGKNISNVADAVTDDQAVNLGQLNSLVTSTNNQQNVVINQIKTDIGDMDKLGATFDVSGQNMTEHKDLVSTINAMNTGGIKYMHTNGVPEVDEQGKIGPTNDSSAGGKNSSAIGVNAIIQAGGTSSVAMGHNSFVGNDATDAVAIGSGAQATGSSAIAIGHNSIASGKQALSVGTGNVVSGNNSGAFGDPNIVSGNNSYALGNNNTIAADNSFTVGNDIVIDRNVDDMTQANGASFKGSMGLGNGSTVAAAVGTKSVTIQNHTYDFAGSAPVGTVSVGSAGSERTVTNVAAGRISETSTDAINGSQLYATNEAVNNLNKGAAGIVQYSDGNNPTVSNGGVVSNNATLTGKPATVDRNGDGKVDAADGTDPVRLSNVAAGAAPTDAANVGQLQQMGSTLNNRINQVENNANAGTATAMAVAGLPQAYLPGKSMVAVAGSVYRGETGYAVGYSSISDGGNWVVKASASGNSRGHIGGTLGAGYQW
ncbi:hypothetical protein ADP71_07570 [Vitreoscilla sp. C1]|uniref:YadA-like family protein n=1 Tax=Vitreoscilla sp. (strain C1) TaxID=96942 RepID=UPI00148EED7A|nr:YadA-like family protein [Vitreoscilla sp. C1]AUZ04513.2 hypothetical protein ADP71_07570 [Vitreoscilla sp. C1]